MADDTMQLPPGYEDAKPVQPKLQLPPGYEDAQPVAAKTVYAGPKAGQITPPPAAQPPTLEGAQRASGTRYEAPSTEAPGTVGEQQAIAERGQQHPIINAVGKGIEKANETAGKMSQAGAEFGKTVAQAPVVAASAIKELPQVIEQAVTPRMGPTPNLEDPEAIAKREHPIAMGVTGAVGGMAGGMVADPRQWPLLFLGGETVGPLIQKAISAGFGANMAKETIEGAKQLGANWDNMTPEERAEQITSLGLSDVFAGMAGAHVIGGEAGARAGYNAARDVVNPVDSAEVKALSKETAKAEKLYDAAKMAMNNYKHSLGHGVNPPENILKAYDKAAQGLAIAKFHEEVAREGVAKATAERREANVPAVTPQPPTKEPGMVTKPAPELAPEPEITAKAAEPTLSKLGAPKAPPTVSPAHATTTVPQEPTEAPKIVYRTMQLPGGEPVGKQALLTEGTPEGPQVPKGGLPKINMPEEKPAAAVAPKPVTDEAALRALSAKKGEVIETPEAKVKRLLVEALKTGNYTTPPKAEEATPTFAGEERREKPRPATMSPTEIEAALQNRKPVHTPFDVTEGAMDTIKRDQAMPKHPSEEAATKNPVLPKEEPTGYAAKKEEVVPAGEEGREPVKSAAEYHPAVQQKVGELSDEKLRQLAKAHGLNPDEYDFNARDDHRHRIERDQLAKEITEQMGEDEKINLGRAAEQTEKQGLFQGADTSAKGRAARAEKMFPRLRGPVDEYGNPKIGGGAPDTAGTKEEAKKDTEHFANAKKELGTNASISEVAKRAQEMKDTHAQLAAHEANGGSTFSPKGKDLNGTDKYSVGAYPDRTEQVDKLTPERLEEFKKKNSDVLSKEDHAVGTWKDLDTGKAVLDVTKLYDGKDEAIAAGKAANQKAIYHLGGEGEIQTGGTGEALENKDFPDKIERPKTKGKDLPTGDALIKKYGETKTNDPKGITFILDDGRKVGNTGVDHDQMLGGKATDKNPLRERFVQEGNIRVREHQGAGGRTVAFSIPESGVNAAQLAAIKAMGPQLSSGGVAFEIGQLGGKYETIPYGEATSERMENAIKNITGKGTGTGEAPKSLGSAAAGAALSKEPPTNLGTVPGTDVAVASRMNPKELGTLKTNVSRENAVENMAKLPAVQELVDVAQQGAGERKWYQRSGQAFTALVEAAKNSPDIAKYFKPEMRDKFVNFVAALSPQQPVKMDMQESLHAWTKAVDMLNDGASDKAITSMLHKELTMSTSKVNSAVKALKGKPIWDDLRTKAFKVPSFGDNLNGFLDRVTQDGWMALFHGIENAGDLSKASLYHPMSVLTRLAAEHLGWEPAEAQAAIWAVVKTLTEKGTVDQADIREYSHDVADLVQHDPDIRQQLTEMGFDTNELDKQLTKHVEAKPEVTSGVSTSGKDSLRKLVSRVQRLRPDALSETKIKTINDYIDQASEPEGTGREPTEETGSTEFNPEEPDTVAGRLAKLGEKKKKSPYGNVR